MSSPDHAGSEGAAGQEQLAARLSALEDRLAPWLPRLDRRLEDVEGALDAVEALGSVPPPGEAAAAGTPATGTDEPATPALPGIAVPDAGSGAEALDDDAGIDMRELVPWVRDHIALLLERRIMQTGGAPHWCQEWWMHPEAIARFDALRRSWLEAITVAEGSALAVYYEHVDMHLAALTSDSGPFASCREHHRSEDEVQPLGQIDPPATYFVDLDALADP